MKDSVKEILLRFDEIGQYETPKQFDYADLERRVIELSINLQQRFGHTFKIDAQVQDASFFCDLTIPIKLVINPKPNIGYSIRISNFGNLATINFREEYPREMTDGIIEQLDMEGFLFVDIDEIDYTYDGKFNDFKKISSDYEPSWYVRYFDYL